MRNKSIKEWESFQWKEVKKSSDEDTATWKIYSRKVKGTNSREYKIEGEIGSSPQNCIAAFRQEINQQASKLDNKEYPTYEIVSESADSLLTYVIHNEPFPFKDTEMLVQYVFSTGKDGSTEVKWKESWDQFPIEVSRKLNRVKTFSGSWQFALIAENHLQAINIVRFDPKGMPKMLFQPMVIKFLKEGLENLRDNTTE